MEDCSIVYDKKLTKKIYNLIPGGIASIIAFLLSLIVFIVWLIVDRESLNQKIGIIIVCVVGITFVLFITIFIFLMYFILCRQAKKNTRTVEYSFKEDKIKAVVTKNEQVVEEVLIPYNEIKYYINRKDIPAILLQNKNNEIYALPHSEKLLSFLESKNIHNKKRK